MLGEELLQEIDSTLNQLLENAKAFDETSQRKLTSYEKEVFQKTQESLLAHLISVDQKWETRREELKKLPTKTFPIQKKWIHLQKIHGKSFENLSNKMGVFTLKRRRKASLKKSKAL